jgi:hypothetical protein
MNNCQYCSKEIPNDKRSDAKFCSVNCKCNNRKMKRYWESRAKIGKYKSIKLEDFLKGGI